MVSLLTLCLLLAVVPALADTASGGASYSGKIEYRDTVTVKAPFGGTLEAYSLRAGDAVTAGETLFTLSTTKIYAPFNGVVRGLRAVPGDEASGVAERYGALLYLEPESKFAVDASSAGAYDSTDNHNANRYLNQGDVVYLQSTEDHARTGEGVVTTVDGRDFTVEVSSGNLDPEDSVTVYRDAGMATSGRLARSARVRHAEAAAITAEGSVLRCAVQEGQSVKRGDLLLETVSGTLDGLKPVGDTIAAPADGVLVSVDKTAGAAVAKDDVLATFYEQSSLQAVFDIDESDLSSVSEGMKLTVTPDAFAGSAEIAGTIESISSIPVSEEGSAQYAVYVKLENTDSLRCGMSVTVRLP